MRYGRTGPGRIGPTVARRRGLPELRTLSLEMLVVAPSRQTATLTLGTQQFLPQFVSDWNAVLAGLTVRSC